MNIDQCIACLDSVAPTDEQRKRAAEVAEAGKAFAKVLCEHCPEGACLDAALTQIVSACQSADEGIRKGGG